MGKKLNRKDANEDKDELKEQAENKKHKIITPWNLLEG